MKLQKDGQTFFQSARVQGLCGLALATSAHGADIAGSTLTCTFLSKSIARLASAIGVTGFIAECATQEAIEYLEGIGTSVQFDTVFDGIDASEAFEQRFLVDASNGDMLDRVRRQTLAMIDNHIVPNDDQLLDRFVSRLGRGAGGT